MVKPVADRRIEIEESPEPEIQYLATPALFNEIHEWLEKRGSNRAKTSRDPVEDVAIYYDTKNFRLLREGIEYRVKEKGRNFRHDMKLPLNPAYNREVLPDENDILWRKELKFKTAVNRPSLSTFWGQAILEPVRERLKKSFFQKELLPQFLSVFKKEKIDHIAECGSRIEYSFQTGHMESMDRTRKTKPYHILELELRNGDLEGLLAEKGALEAVFGPKGLQILPVRKVLLGFELLEDGMTPKQRASYKDAKIRNSRAYAAAIEEAGFNARLAA